MQNSKFLKFLSYINLLWGFGVLGFCGFGVVVLWFLCGFFVVSLWLLCGYSVVTFVLSLWFICGFFVVSVLFCFSSPPHHPPPQTAYHPLDGLWIGSDGYLQ